MHNILTLHHDLKNKTFTHGPYHHFRISDPKPRDIHKASVRDRLLHHALYRMLYPYFDKRFIADSYSCRTDKGTHRAINRFRIFARKVSRNHTRTAWILKCDIRKFFASVDHNILFHILKRSITDQDILWLLAQVVGSFSSNAPTPTVLGADILKFSRISECTPGLPLGNLTSQLLVNIYMNEFDQYVKHTLKAKYYVRYTDDFVFLSRDKEILESICRYIGIFLKERLKLVLHPKKVSITTYVSGVDFLGWVHFPDHLVLRTSTKRRMLKRVKGLEEKSPTVPSYLGILSHGNTRKLANELTKLCSGETIHNRFPRL